MSDLSAKPILELIQQDAREAADKLILEARDRAATISEQASLRVQQQLDETTRQAQAEADLLEDRMRRLAMLEERKGLVAHKRGLIDQAFAQALDQLNALPDDQVAQVMGSLLDQFAQGTETLAAGAINDGFFTQAFVDAANGRLAARGKPGSLAMEPGRHPGVCGLILRSARTEMHCTFAALVETRRDALEARVASILFPASKD